MTTEKMTVHKALAELKVLDDRILVAIGACNLITTKKNNQDKVRGKTVAEFTADAKSAYDKATDLIKRRNAIKDAVNVSNANTTVKIGDQEYTVVQAIDKKNHGMDFFKSLRDTMVEQLAKAKTDLERNNDSLQQKAEQFVTGLMGNKDAKTNGDEFDASVRTYIKSNSMELIDPVGLEKRIEELDSMITAFMTEIDASLSVSNALTTIEITY
ncbi:hypothetical protein AALD01_07450 [Oscillospiraceae bacterium 21-37]